MTILLVEDDHAVRKLVYAVLTGEGYTVLDARTAEAAVALVESARDPIDLLITDVVLPHLSGYDLAQWTRSLNPETKVIYISGYLESELLELSRNDPKSTFIQKPFSPAELSEAIRRLLSQRQGRTFA